MIGDRLRLLREEKKFTKRKLAQELDLKYSTYCGYESGAREPASDSLTLFSKYYNVSIDYILGLTQERTTDVFCRNAFDHNDDEISPEALEVARAYESAGVEVKNCVRRFIGLPEIERQVLSNEEKEEAKALGFDLDDADRFAFVDKKTGEERPLTEEEKFRYKRNTLDAMFQKSTGSTSK
jgi:transcriptional regulator with XRE-family HTH domain